MNSTISGTQEPPRGQAGFMEFARNFTPDSARAEVERLLRTGQMTRQQYDELSSRVAEFARSMGIRI